MLAYLGEKRGKESRQAVRPKRQRKDVVVIFSESMLLYKISLCALRYATEETKPKRGLLTLPLSALTIAELRGELKFVSRKLRRIMGSRGLDSGALSTYGCGWAVHFVLPWRHLGFAQFHQSKPHSLGFS